MNSLVMRSSLSSAKRTRGICGRADPAGQFKQMVNALSLIAHVTRSTEKN